MNLRSTWAAGQDPDSKDVSYYQHIKSEIEITCVLNI